MAREKKLPKSMKINEEYYPEEAVLKKGICQRCGCTWGDPFSKLTKKMG